MLNILLIALLIILALAIISLGVVAFIIYKIEKTMFARIDSELVSENN